METVDGVLVTDEMIQKRADEAKRGYDVGVLRRRGRRLIGDDAARAVPVRMDDSLVAAVDQRAEKDGTGHSEIIRLTVRVFIA